MPRKSKLEKMSQTHGQLETFKPTLLSQIIGDTGLDKYGTMDEDIYVNQLKNMNKSDLQAHATRVGLVPIDDRERLTKRLMHEFRLHVAAYRYPTVKPTPQNPVSPEVAKILAQGR